MTTLSKVFIGVLIFFLTLFGSCKALIYHIYHHMDCNQFNIDHIEVRTGIDVPKTVSSLCNLNADQTRRDADFVLDTTVVDINQWLIKNKFTKYGIQYERSGKKADHNWQATFRMDKNQLLVQIVYK